MEALCLQPHSSMKPPFSLTTHFLKLKLKPKPKTLLQLHPICSAIQVPNAKPSTSTISKSDLDMLKEKWLTSLSWPSPVEVNGLQDINGGSNWVIGVDPDVSGALALLKPDLSGSGSDSGLGLGSTYAEVFDSPTVHVSVGKTRRRRLDARSIVQLVKSFDAPIGTTAYVEQSTPFPQDGKQGWWSGGFGYGLWIGVLVASGFSVVPVPSNVWKKAFELSGSRTSKDDSRELAAQFFPELSPMLKRKKDHGRAEALLIAAYGKGLKTKPAESCEPDMIPEL